MRTNKDGIERELEGAFAVGIVVERLSKVTRKSERGRTVAVADHEDDVGLDGTWRPRPMPDARGNVRDIVEALAMQGQQGQEEESSFEDVGQVCCCTEPDVALR